MDRSSSERKLESAKLEARAPRLPYAAFSICVIGISNGVSDPNTCNTALTVRPSVAT